jgi:excinuclease ABC subunit B
VTAYRRSRQLEYNKKHNITPRSVSRPVEDSLALTKDAGSKAAAIINDSGGNFDVLETIREIEAEMLEASNNLEFEKAALLRDQVRELKRGAGMETPAPAPKSTTYRISKPGRKRKGAAAR